MSFVEVIVNWHVVVFSENVIVAAELPGEPVGAAIAPTAPTVSITTTTAPRKSFRIAFLPRPPTEPKIDRRDPIYATAATASVELIDRLANDARFCPMLPKPTQI